jgi:glycerol-3-phosphate dehydrogenase
VHRVLGSVAGAHPERPPRLVKGSHIVVPRMFAGEHAYILQNPDKRIVFAIPYEGDFTLIGTTDMTWQGDPGAPAITDAEIRYLCESVNAFFAKPVSPADIIWTYSGIRPLFDDGSANASAVTRDYVLTLGTTEGPQILSAFGGKITTYRTLAEHALDKLAPFLPAMGPFWTATAALPGGDIPDGDFATFLADVRRRWPFLESRTAQRMARAYGTRLPAILGDATSMAALGRDFGGGLSEAEVDYLCRHEWARTADDILWRRSKLGLHTGPETRAALEDHLAATTA